MPAINVSEVSGNPFQPNVEFRGFVGSPVSGTPQGLAVYQNGVRINEAFGDTVNWDLIPTAAIKSIAVVTNNPAFGLNALGGAVTVQMKDGFNYHGAEIDMMGGSYGRLQGSAQWGKQVDHSRSMARSKGCTTTASAISRRPTSAASTAMSAIEARTPNSISISGVADNKFGAPATTPVELLQQYWGATYTTPQTSANQVGYVNLTGKVEVTPTWTVEAVAHVRAFHQQTLDGNPTGTQPCAADPTLLCFNDDSHAGQRSEWRCSSPIRSRPMRSSEKSTAPARARPPADSRCRRPTPTSCSVTTTALSSAPASTPASRISSPAPNSAPSAPNYVVSGSGIFLGQSGNPVSIGPVSLRTTNQYTGLYALDTFDVTKAFSITAGGRFNDARIALEDQIGSALNGNATYDRFNPIIGGTYKITPELTAYAGYSEANRAPTPLELGCADPAIPASSRPSWSPIRRLKQVVSRTVEAGLRGTQGHEHRHAGLEARRFPRHQHRRHPRHSRSRLQGFGYFQNVGSTRRQGIEAEAKLKSSAFQVYASYTFIDARFLDALQVGSNSPFADAERQRPDRARQPDSAIPRHRVKAGFDYSITDAFKVGADALYVSSQYFVGDESNQAPKLPSYTVFNVHASYQINKTFQIYGKVDNLFDNRYATYGTFFDTGALPNFANGGAPFTDARSLSPACPRTFYAGLKMTF